MAGRNFYICSPGDLEGLLNYSEQNVNVSDILKLGLPPSNLNPSGISLLFDGS